MSNRNTNNENPLPVDYMIHEHEVYCGSGSKGQRHVGNRKFRHMILQNMERYQAATKQHEKSAILDEMVATVCQNSPHGFIKKDHKTGRLYIVANFIAREKTSQAFRDAIQEKSKEATNSNKTKNPTIMSSIMSNKEYERNDPLSPTPLSYPISHSQSPLPTKMITSNSNCCLSSKTINDDARQNSCDEMKQTTSESSSTLVSSKIACSRLTNQQFASIFDMLESQRKIQSNTSNTISHAFHTDSLEDTVSTLNCLLSPENDCESLIATNSDVMLFNSREYVNQIKGIMSDKEATFSNLNSSVLHSKNSLSADDDNGGSIKDSRTFNSPDYSSKSTMTTEMVSTSPYNYVKNTSQDDFGTSVVHPFTRSQSNEGMVVVDDTTMKINDSNAITFLDNNELSNHNSERIENDWVRDDVSSTTITTAIILSPIKTFLVNNDKSESDYDMKTFDTLFLLTILYPDLETCPFLDPHRISNDL